MIAYFELMRDNREVPAPLFSHPMMSQNTLYLREVPISKSASLALRQFLADTANVPECWVKSLHIDGCKIEGESFANMMEGVLAQGKHLTSLNISNYDFGPNCDFQRLVGILPNLTDLSLCNIKSQGMNAFRFTKPSIDLIKEL